MPELSRRLHIAPQVLVVDGLSGNGKSAVAPILLGLSRVENVLVRYVFEYLCCANHLGRVTDDAVESLIRLLTDITAYDNSISREVNFRPSDITSVLKTHLRGRYLERLFLADGKAALGRIAQERPILHLMTHQAFGVSTPFFRALGNRLTFVEVVRHPLNMMRHQFGYIERYGTDPSDFTVWLGYKGHDLPWFAMGNEELYLKSRAIDKVIFSLKWMAELKARTLSNLLSEQQERLVVVPFERFVKDPEPYLSRLELLLETTRLPVMNDILHEHRIPRGVSNAGPEGVWPEKYGTIVPGEGATDESELMGVWTWVGAEASPEALSVLRELCRAYEQTYLA